MFFYPIEGAYPSSAFGTATPSYLAIDMIWPNFYVGDFF